MATTPDTKKKRTTGTPKFLRHLYCILTVEDPTIISWAPDGSCFQLFNVKRMETEVLPKYFKHNKLSSFQRQLNYFGFRKWTKTQSCVCTFSHPQFNRFSTPETLATVRKQPSFEAYTPEPTTDDDQDLMTWPLSVPTDNDADDPITTEDNELTTVVALDDINTDDWDICIDVLNSPIEWAKAEVVYDTPSVFASCVV
ncbi:Aste57867_2680 [Aphanomyces stellatus]|uniref:Aste57867_2680 protein n=1 Tax=Aphanomyces stellatus TaxID=120398 RepID=A0A485K8U1_9STRA|nr:hypothetical protein As57867_002673 [Aphanomyces stellatus]VFT79874.1 Aste57867_2680 [Aphanomyces stellatus]